MCVRWRKNWTHRRREKGGPVDGLVGGSDHNDSSLSGRVKPLD